MAEDAPYRDHSLREVFIGADLLNTRGDARCNLRRISPTVSKVRMNPNQLARITCPPPCHRVGDGHPNQGFARQRPEKFFSTKVDDRPSVAYAYQFKEESNDIES